MLKADFSDAEAKLERTNEHITNLERIIAGFLHTDFYRLTLEADQMAGRMQLVHESLHQPSKNLNLVLGDAIGCLRTVLDYGINAALFPVTGTYRDGGFPFKDNPKDLENTIKKGPIGLLGTVFVDLLLDEIQAKKGGAGEALWILNNLRNIDKHRLLVATAEMAAVTVSFKQGGITVEDCTFGWQAGKRGIVLDAPIGHLQLTSEPRPVFEVRLNEPPYIEHVEVLGFLRQAASEVRCILKAFKVADLAPEKRTP